MVRVLSIAVAIAVLVSCGDNDAGPVSSGASRGQPRRPCSNRDGIGALVKVVADGRLQIDEVRSGSSFLSQNDMRLHFGLGAVEKIELVEIRWPSGIVEQLTDVEANQVLTLYEPDGSEYKQ